MFGPEFFPTPRHIAKKMMAKISHDAVHILDPQAGKGDLAAVARGDGLEYDGYAADGRYSRSGRGHRKVDCIEINPELAAILMEKDFPVVGYDWLDYAGVSYYDAIIMNPPFSNGDEHLLKAWDFLHAGEIVCLLNEQTIKNPYTERRKRVVQLIEQHGTVEYLDQCFHDAQRQTDVPIALVYLKKTAEDDTLNLWAVKNDEKPVDTSEFDGDEAMLAIRDNLGNMEHWYNMATEHVVQAIHHLRKASTYASANSISMSEDYKTAVSLGFGNINAARAEFIKLHRRDCWKQVFEKMEFRKWLDKKQTNQFLRDVERNGNVPFTADNIKATLENVYLQRRKLFEMSVANVFEELTKFYKGNSYGGGGAEAGMSGWKSNDSYKVNEKLVFPYGCRYDKDSANFSLWYNQGAIDIYNDVDRVLCVLDGKDFEHCVTISTAMSRAFGRLEAQRAAYGSRGSRALWSQSDQVADSQYFEIRFFMKGTVHLKWKRKDLWEKFNTTAAAGRKWIGENTQQERTA